MSPSDRLVNDYLGVGLTVGQHPMAHRRAGLRGVLRAADLKNVADKKWVRVAGSVIVRQRPGTAKGFVFMSLEDESGIANIIIEPDVFETQREAITGSPFILVEGYLQHQDGVISVKARKVSRLEASSPAVRSHDFH